MQALSNNPAILCGDVEVKLRGRARRARPRGGWRASRRCSPPPRAGAGLRPRDRRPGRPADPGLALRLGGGKRHRHFVPRAVETVVKAPTAAPRAGAATGPGPLEWLSGMVGVGLFAIVVYAGLRGNRTSPRTWPLPRSTSSSGSASRSHGFPRDLFRPFNPWRAVGRLAGWLLPRIGYRRGPLLGSYPEVVGPLAGSGDAARLRLAGARLPEQGRPGPARDPDDRLRGVQLAGIAAFGVRRGASEPTGSASTRTDRQAVAAVLARRELRLRRPLSGLGDLKLWPGTAAVLFVLIGSTSFDGFSNGEVWYRSHHPWRPISATSASARSAPSRSSARSA